MAPRHFVLIAAALAMSACTPTDAQLDARWERGQRRMAVELMCSASTAQRCPESGCAPWRVGVQRRMPMTILFPAGQRGSAELCIDGACGEALMDSHLGRGRSTARYVAGHELGFYGPIEFHNPTDEFTMRLRHGGHEYTWEGECVSGAPQRTEQRTGS